MIGTYDFCAHYEWTFAWLEAAGGEQLLQEYWTDAIGEDSQRHAAKLIQGQGFEGMMKYWGHTLAEESPEKGYHMTQSPSMVRCDMHDCPSKGFLIKNNLQQYKDYCNHCIAWIRPVVEHAGFRIDHEHNHQGQCWWEFREQENPSPASETGEVSGHQDVRHLPHWPQKEHHRFPEKSDSDKSQSSPPSPTPLPMPTLAQTSQRVLRFCVNSTARKPSGAMRSMETGFSL